MGIWSDLKNIVKNVKVEDVVGAAVVAAVAMNTKKLFNRLDSEQVKVLKIQRNKNKRQRKRRCWARKSK